MYRPSFVEVLLQLNVIIEKILQTIYLNFFYKGCCYIIIYLPTQTFLFNSDATGEICIL